VNAPVPVTVPVEVADTIDEVIGTTVALPVTVAEASVVSGSQSSVEVGTSVVSGSHSSVLVGATSVVGGNCVETSVSVTVAVAVAVAVAVIVG